MTGTSRSLGSNPILILEPRALVTGLFSFEALLLLYLFAGFYKGDPRFAWLPVDATALFFVLSVVVGSFIIVFNPIYKKGLPLVFAMVCFVTWFLISLTWSPSRLYGPDKVFFMATLELWGVIAGALIIAPDRQRVRRLFTLLLLLSLWVGVETLIVYATGKQRSSLEVGSANYIILGRLCGLGALVALAGWLSNPGRMVRGLCLVLLLALGFVLAIVGARGPLLAAGLALLLPVALGVRLTTRKIRYSRAFISVIVLLLALAGGLTAYTMVTGKSLGTFKRIERLLTGLGGQLEWSEADRVDLYADAARLYTQAPLLGHGAGSWPVLTGHRDARNFPHNLFSEVLVETGLVGLLVLVALFATTLRPVSLERLRHDPQALCVMMLFACAFLNAMVSGDVPDNRAMFIFMGMLALVAIQRTGDAPAPAAARSATLDGGALAQPAAAWRRQAAAAGMAKLPADG